MGNSNTSIAAKPTCGGLILPYQPAGRQSWVSPWQDRHQA